jgi:hypothetical protein
MQNVKLHLLASSPSGIEGKIYYNSTDKKIYYYNGSSWTSLGSVDAVAWGDITGKPSTFEPTEESVQDIIGAMVAGNTETNISVTYDDATGKLNFIISAIPNTIVSQDATHRFVTDSEKSDWNAKETISGAQTKADSAESSANSHTDTAIANLIASSPATLDTLNELAAALGDDPNFATTITNALANKVDKVAGKGLSANDFTDTLLNKLNVIASGAEVNTVDRYETTIGNGSLTSFTINHNLGNQYVDVSVIEIASNSKVYTDIVCTDANNATVSFSTAPTTNQYKVICIG